MSSSTVIESLSGRLADSIRKDIIKGVHPQGVRLKTEALAELYKVSANPVREALWQLQGEGFVILAPYQGARVRVVDDDFVHNIFEIREVIAPLFAKNFCEYHTSADLDRLLLAEDNFAEAGSKNASAKELGKLDNIFHAIVIENEANSEAIQVLGRYSDMINAARLHLSMTNSRIKARVQEHAAITFAFKHRDSLAAQKATVDHVRAAGEYFLDQMRVNRRRNKEA